MSAGVNQLVKTDQKAFHWTILMKYNTNAFEGGLFNWSQFRTKEIEIKVVDMLVDTTGLLYGHTLFELSDMCREI